MAEENGSVCIPCSRDEIREHAIWFCSDCQENLCETCASFHKRSRASFKHRLVNVTETSNDCYRDILYSSEELDGPGKCNDHNYKKCTYFCETHDRLCCSKCAIENHRHCNDLLHISKYTKQDKFIGEIITIEHDLAMLAENAKIIIEYESGHACEVRKKQGDECKKGEETRDRLVAVVQNAFAERKTAITETADKIVLRSDKLKVHTEECLRDITHFQELHRQAKQSNDEAAKVAIMKSVATAKANLWSKLEAYYKQLSSETISSDLKVEVWSNSLSHIPTVQTKTIYKRMPLFNETPTICSDTAVTGGTDPKPCLKECCVLDSGIIVATDDSAKVVRLFNTVNETELECFEVESEPWGISRIQSDEVAVSLPFSNKLLFMSFTKGKLKVSSSIITESACFSIASFKKDGQNLLAAYSKINGVLILVDTDCKQLVRNTKSLLFSGKIVPFINYIVANGKNSQFYLSCYKQHKVYACDFDGNILWQFSNAHLHTPFGLELDVNGNILVCSCGTGKILLISNKGELIRVYINNDKLSEPVALAYSDGFDKLAVCDFDQGYRVKLFKTKR